MRKSSYDDTKPCSWCNPCPASFCDCGECADPKCKACFPVIEMPPVKETSDDDWSGGGVGEGSLV